MVLALNATDQGGGVVELAVTGAAHATAPAYTSNFASGVDSWSAAALGGTPAAPTTGDAPDGSGTKALFPAGHYYADGLTDPYVQRSVTGRTIGVTYRITATVQLRPTSSVSSASCFLTTLDEAPTTPFTATKGAPVTVSVDVVALGTTVKPLVQYGLGPASPGALLAVWDVTLQAVTAGLEPLQIQRTDDNGSHFVRLEEGQEPDTTSGNLTVDDAEPALAGLVTYVVRDGLGNTAQDTVTLDYPTPLLHTVGYTATLDVDRVDGYTGSRSYQAQTQVLPIIGRADPIATDQGDVTWSLREGDLTFAPQPSYEEAQAIVEVYTAGRVVMLRQPTHPGLDLYHVVREIVGPTPYRLTADGWSWQVVARYVEVGWPAGDLLGTGGAWTYDDLADFALAYWNLPGDFATYADLKAGP